MPLPGTSLPAPDATPRLDEGRHHRESTASVRLKAQRLRRALDTDRLDDAVRIAADVAAELRSTSSSELSPKAYYDVYLSVCAELRLLEMYVMESARRGAPVLELYERVQETPLVLPRLYLLVTAGSVYVKSLQAPAKDVLRDLVEMCAGVQHPQRGLFLRAYLSQMMKDKLPAADPNFTSEKLLPQPIPVSILSEDGHHSDPPDPDSSTGGTVHDSIDFVIRNFTEMNRLWVRMQHDCSPREVELREKERLELRLLVGSNISTLSRLVGNSLALYRDNVLPAILDQIVSCNDAIAQEYLADCVAQVFPDEFQLGTLQAFMQTCGKLVKGVNMRTILVSIINRLCRFAGSSSEAAEAARKAGAFEVFRSELPDVVQRQGTSLQLTDRLRIYVSLMSFALEAEAERLDYVDDVLGFCVVDMEKFLGREHVEPDRTLSRTGTRASNGYSALQAEDEKLGVAVLRMPLEKFQSVGSVLQLENYVVLQGFLSYDDQRGLAAQLLMCSTGYTPCIDKVETLEKLFRYVAPLVQDGWVDEENGEGDEENGEGFDAGSLTHHHEYLLGLIPAGRSGRLGVNGAREEGVNGENGGRRKEEEEDDGRFEQDQELVGRIVYLCDASDVERAVVLYRWLRKELVRGGPRRMVVTMPSLILGSLRLAVRCGRLAELEDCVGETLRFAGECVGLVARRDGLLGLRLQLQVARTGAGLGEVGKGFVYDNVARGFVLYERDVACARDQCMALGLIIGCLRDTRDGMEESGFCALADRAVMHAGRGLTRSDQCVLLCLCARMFGKGMGKRAWSCVEDAVKAGRACVGGGERVLLLLDCAETMGRLVEEGVWIEELDLLDQVLEDVRNGLAGRGARAWPLGKVAAGRYGRLVAHFRVLGKMFVGLDFSKL